jgi:hypothetical protein
MLKSKGNWVYALICAIFSPAKGIGFEKRIVWKILLGTKALGDYGPLLTERIGYEADKETELQALAVIGGNPGIDGQPDPGFIYSC